MNKTTLSILAAGVVYSTLVVAVKVKVKKITKARDAAVKQFLEDKAFNAAKEIKNVEVVA